MNFDALKRRVERSERLVEGRIEQASEHRACLGRQWRQAWTPGRIIVIGLVGGFLVARARPMRTLGAVSATRWVQLATSLSGLVAALQAAWAAQTAESAAQDAEGAADTATAVAGDAAATAGTAPPVSADAAVELPPVSARPRRPDPQWDTAPSPAEAATEVSER